MTGGKPHPVGGFTRRASELAPGEFRVGRRLVGVTAADVPAEGVETLFPDMPMIAGELNILAGAQGLGKTAVATHLAARVTREHERGVVIVSSEDGPRTVLRPRLEVAGAALKRVGFLRALESAGVFSIRDDCDGLEAMIGRYAAELVVIDPWTNHLDGTDVDRGTDVRRALRPLIETGRRLGVTTVLVAHFNKSGVQDWASRIAHSSALTQVARAAFIVAVDPDAPHRDAAHILVAHCKHNLTPRYPTMRYEIDASAEVPDHRAGYPPISAPRLIAAGVSPYTHTQLLDPRLEQGNRETAIRTERAAALILEHLGDGELHNGSEIIARIREQAGMGRHTVYSAAALLEESNRIIRTHSARGKPSMWQCTPELPIAEES